jgi:hypothetical protein
MIYEVRYNRMFAMRMRDGRRWVNAYREKAWVAAVEDARRRSWLSTMIYAATVMMRSRFLG